MKTSFIKTLWLIMYYAGDFFLSVRILFLFIIVSVFILAERLIFPSSDKIYSLFVLLGVLPSIILSMPIKMNGRIDIFVNRKKIIDLFVGRGFTVCEMTERKICLKKSFNTWLEWNQRRVIIEYKEEICEVEILFCDKKIINSLLIK